jgi:putative aldouronate transport system substrate-binding protein
MLKNSMLMVLMPGLLLCMITTGCAKSNSPKSDKAASGTQPVLTYALTTQTAWSDRYKTFADLPIGKRLQKDTGITLNMLQVKDATAMNLLIAAGNLPDVIQFNWKFHYSGGEQKAIQDGVIYGMSEDFVQKYAPNYWKVISSDPDILKQVKTPEGQIIGFSFILGDELLKSGKGLIIRDDWCRDLGIDIPETADGYYKMLKAFKEKKSAKVPLSVTSAGLEEMLSTGMITSAFGLPCTDSYLKNGKVVLGYAQPEYKAVLIWLHKLYKEGLLDANFSTLDQQTLTANILTGAAGAAEGPAGSSLGAWLSAGGNNYSLAGIKGLVEKKGDVPMFAHYNNTVIGAVASITLACKDKPAVAKFLDYGYSSAGHMLYNFGIEGESYTMKDGQAFYTDLILKNPKGLSIKQALSEYSCAYDNGPFVQDKNYLLQYYAYDAQKTALKNWSYSNVRKYKMPTITISQDKSALYSSVLSDINSYKSEMLIKFVRGTESLDNFDQYLTTLNRMGCDKIQQLQQAAYEEYVNR